MKIFLWSNMSGQTDFANYGSDVNIAMPNSSNAHSGGIVVIAETLEKAIELAKKYTEGKSPVDCNEDFCNDEKLDTKPIVLNIDKEGVVLYCDGDC